MILSAGFSSSHRTVVNLTVEFWNDSFGLQDHLEYPVEIELALRAVRPLVALQPPTFPEGPDDEVRADSLFKRLKLTAQYPNNDILFTESQHHFESTTLRTGLDNVSKYVPTGCQLAKTVEHVLTPKAADLLLSHWLPFRKDVRVKTPERLVRSPPARQTSKARLLHEDSQIQFAAIDSSPLNPQALGSQMLTDRQKEVGTRQQAEANALFPDMFSSPVTKTVYCEDPVGHNKSKASPGASDGARPAALREEVYGGSPPSTDQDASMVDDILLNVSSSPPEMPITNTFDSQARRPGAEDVPYRRTYLCSRAASSGQEQEFQPPTLSWVNDINKKQTKLQSVLQTNADDIRQSSINPPADKDNPPVVRTSVSDAPGAAGQAFPPGNVGHGDEERKTTLQVGPKTRELDGKLQSASLVDPVLRIPDLSSNSTRPLIQMDGTNETDVDRLHDQLNNIQDTVLGTALANVQAKETAIGDGGNAELANNLAEQEMEYKEGQPAGSKNEEDCNELNQGDDVSIDQPGQYQSFQHEDQSRLEASTQSHSEELELGVGTSSPRTSRVDVFVDAPSSPVGEKPQTFVDASQTPLPSTEKVAGDFRASETSFDANVLQLAEGERHAHQPRDDIGSRVRDSFIGETVSLLQHTEVDSLAISGGGDDQISSQTSVADSQTTPRRTRKRKSGPFFGGKTAKRHKLEVSPASLMPSKKEENVAHDEREDQEIGDCIVVASQPSQVSQIHHHSPDTTRMSGRESIRKQASSIHMTRASRLSQHIPDEAQSSRKRRHTSLSHQTHNDEHRATPITLIDEMSAPKRRRRSRRSEAEDDEAGNMKSMSALTSPPVRMFSHVEIPLYTEQRTRLNVKQQTPQAMDLRHASRTAQIYDPNEPQSTGAVESVAPKIADSATGLNSKDVGADPEGNQVRQQVNAELEASVHTPLSSQRKASERDGGRASNRILARLEAILQDCRRMILVSAQEEREFDDVLFHLRREVYKAGRRGRRLH